MDSLKQKLDLEPIWPQLNRFEQQLKSHSGKNRFDSLGLRKRESKEREWTRETEKESEIKSSLQLTQPHRGLSSTPRTSPLADLDSSCCRPPTRAISLSLPLTTKPYHRKRERERAF